MQAHRVHTRSDDPIIAARDVVKRYGETIAVAGLDLTIWPGEIFGILGPNGAGKTTTLEMLEGLRAPDSGEMRVAGFDPVTEPERVHRVIGVQLQSTALFDYLNCAEIIALFAALYGADASPARVERLLALVGLEEKRRSRINTLSGGQQQRLAIALALVNTPRIAFLDEPTTGLDPAARRTLWQTIRDIRDDGDDGRPDDALYGRSRAVVRPHRHHGPRPGGRLRYAARVDPATSAPTRQCAPPCRREASLATTCNVWKAW